MDDFSNGVLKQAGIFSLAACINLEIKGVLVLVGFSSLYFTHETPI